MRDQARGGGLAVGAGDGDHRDAAVVAGGEQLVDHGLADGAALAVGRRQVHAQAGRGIDLDHAAVLLFQRPQHAFADHVDAADVQAHHLRRRHGARGHLGMHVVGHVGGGAAGAQVGVVAQQHALRPWPGTDSGVRPCTSQPREGDVVEADLGQRGGVAFAAPRVCVDDVDQFAHGVHAVADHLRRVAPGGGHQLVAHHQQAEVVAGQELLDHDRRRYSAAAR